MATEVFTVEVITLQDGTEVELRPLVISKMRKFSRIWAEYMSGVNKALKEAVEADKEEDSDYEFDEAGMSDAQYDAMMALSVLCLSSLKDEQKKTDKQFKDYLEDVLDEPTIRKVLLKCGNLKLGDESAPNPENQPVPVGTN